MRRNYAKAMFYGWVLIIPMFLRGSLSVYAESITPTEQLDFADGLLDKGFYRMAAEEYRRFIESFPESEYVAEAYFGLAESLFYSKLYSEAIDWYRKYSEHFPAGKDYVASALRTGQILFLANKYDEALDHFSSIKKDNLNAAELQTLYFYTGKVHGAKGEKDKAVQVFKEAVGANPSKDSELTSLALLEIGDMLSAESDYEKAVPYYVKAQECACSEEVVNVAVYKQAEAYFYAGNYTTAGELFRGIVKKRPAGGILQDSLANLLLSSFYDSAYKDVVSEYEKNEGLITNGKAFLNAYYIVACAYAELERYDEALSILDKLLASDSLSEENRQRAFLKKAEILIKAKRFGAAKDLLEVHIGKTQSESAEPLFLRAEAFYGLGNYGASYILYKEISEKFTASPFYDYAIYNMAYALKADGKERPAIRSFIKYFHTGKDKRKREEALYNAILTEKELTLTKDAIRHSRIFLSAFKNGNKYDKVLFQLGLFYSDLKQYKRATRVFLRFVKRFRQNPKSQEAYFLLGYNLQLSGKYDKALEYYGKIASDDTGGKLFYAALKNTVLIYLNNGNEDKAEETLMRIITDFEKNDLETGTYIWLAERYLNKKRFKDVLNVIEKAEANNGLSQKAGEIAYLKAESERELGNLTEADKLYDVVLSSQDGDGYYAASHIGKGLCFVETGDFEKAKKEFEAAIETSPEDNAITIKARFEMANAESLSGHIEEAGKLYMLVDILYSDNYYCPESLLRAGKLFEKMGRKKEAVALYEEIINKYSKTHAAREAEERISNLAG